MMEIYCGVFVVDLHKAFVTVDHQIVMVILNHYGLRGVSNDWFRSDLSNHNQYVFISLAAINYHVPFLNWDSLHPRLNSHYKAWSYKKKGTKRLKYTGNLFRKNLQLIGVC